MPRAQCREQRVPQWGETQEHGQLDAMQTDPIREPLFQPISSSSAGSALSHQNGWDNIRAAKMINISAELLRPEELSPLVDSAVVQAGPFCRVSSSSGPSRAEDRGLCTDYYWDNRSRTQRIVMLFNIENREHLIVHGQGSAAVHRQTFRRYDSPIKDSR